MKRRKSYSTTVVATAATTTITTGVRSRRKCNLLPHNYSLYCPSGNVIRVCLLLIFTATTAISIDYNRNAFASDERIVYSQSAQKNKRNDLTSSPSSAHQRAHDRDRQFNFAPIPMASGRPQQRIPMTRRSNQLYEGDLRDSPMAVISRNYNPGREQSYNNLLAHHQTDPSEAAVDGDDIDTTQPLLDNSHLLHRSSSGRADQYSAHPSQPAPIWSGTSQLGEGDLSDMSSVEPQTDGLIGYQDHHRPSRHHLIEDDSSGAADEAGPLDEDSSPNSSPGSSASDSPSLSDDHPSVSMGGDEQQYARDKLLLSRHQSHIKAINDLFERRQLQLGINNNNNNNNDINNNNNNNNNIVGQPQPRIHQQRRRANNINSNQNTASSSGSNPASPSRDTGPLQSSQELSPISIGLDPTGGPFSPMNPFGLGAHEPIGGPPMGHPNKLAASADNIDQGLGVGPSLPFGLGPLPHLLGFQSPPTFEGPQRGDQSAHSHHSAASIGSEVNEAGGSGGGSGPAAGGSGGASPKTWPKIFRFTDGRINLSDFEKQKKIRLSNKNQHSGENHIDSSPIMFDNRPLKRKSFLILHGGIFSK